MADTPTDDRSAREPIAPWWHTAALVALIVSVSVTGLLLAHRGVDASVPAQAARVTTAYLPLLVVQWSLVAYVSRVGRKENALRSLLGRGWTGAAGAVTDLAVAACITAFIEATELWIGRHGGPVRDASVAALLPQGAREKAMWIIVAASVGFCEEVVYRGYLRIQLSAFTRHAALGIALQAALFGLAHGQQGAFAMLRFALYGVVFGIVARWRRGLLACIVAHVAIDVGSGLFR